MKLIACVCMSVPTWMCAVRLGWAALCDCSALCISTHFGCFPPPPGMQGKHAMNFSSRGSFFRFWKWQLSNSSRFVNRCRVVFGRREVRHVVGLWGAGKKMCTLEVVEQLLASFLYVTSSGVTVIQGVTGTILPPQLSRKPLPPSPSPPLNSSLVELSPYFPLVLTQSCMSKPLDLIWNRPKENLPCIFFFYLKEAQS